MKTLLLLVMFSSVVVAQKKKDPPVSAEEFAENWSRYSRDLTEDLRKKKLLRSNYLQKTRRLNRKLRRTMLRLRRAERVDRLFSASGRAALIRWVYSVRRSKSRERRRLQSILDQLHGKLVAVRGVRTLSRSLRRDLGSWHLHLKNVILKFEKSKSAQKALLKRIQPAGIVKAYATSYLDAADELEAPLVGAITTFKLLLEDL